MSGSHTPDARKRAGAVPGFVLTIALMAWLGAPVLHAAGQPEILANAAGTGGSLVALDNAEKPRGGCPLTHTNVAVEISGFIARTQVTQHFANPFEETIEAVYTFPLPNRAAIDELTIAVGDRIIKGKIKRREEAQAIYQAARSSGRLAGLLDQERPNIFTQALANIEPGAEVTVTIRYVEWLEYTGGAYELVFPMVVGPRYIPGREAAGIAPDSPQARSSSAGLGGGWSYETDLVRHASRITPPITPPGTRAGHDISLTVMLDSGVALQSVRSPSHAIAVERTSDRRVRIELENETEIPNRDFILRYSVAGNVIEDGVLAHRSGADGFFALILQPPAKATAAEIIPKELVFVLDTSGSMSGFPIEKAKETMRMALQGLHSEDTFNLITFAGETRLLFPAPVPATRENLRQAQTFLATRRGRGGTEMMQAIRAALAPSGSRKHIRIVCFMTDGYVGNDMAILAEIKKHPNARIFAFGVGSSVNRFLLDEMAEIGRGEVEYVGLRDDGSAAARRFHERVRSPLLTDISVNWGQLKVQEVLPERIPDLFDAKPLVVVGRYSGASNGIVRVSGKVNGRSVSREIAVTLPATEERHGVLAPLWARQKIAQLTRRDFAGMQRGAPRPDIKAAVLELGLAHRLLTRFTSFVAVEEMTLDIGGEPRRIEVPVEMPDGVSYEMLGFASGGSPSRTRASAHSMPSPTAPPLPRGAIARFPEPAAEISDVAIHGSAADPRSKLSDALQSLLDRPSHALKRTVEVEVQVWLSNASAKTLVELEQTGFEVLYRPHDSSLVIGRITVEKLEDLARLSTVRYVTRLN